MSWVRGVHHGHVVGDLHLLGDLADLEMQVGGGVLADYQNDPAADFLSEAALIGAKFVLANGQGNKQVVAARRGCSRSR